MGPDQRATFQCKLDVAAPVSAEQTARKAHSGQECAVVKGLPSWRYLIRFPDGVRLTAYESELAVRHTGELVTW